jgi:glutathione peroxidase
MACGDGCCESGKKAGSGTAALAVVLAFAIVVFGAAGMGWRRHEPEKKPAAAPAAQPEKKEAPVTTPASPLDFKVTGIDGKECDLSQYKGKVVVIVNVASKCGFTDQYAGLQDLYAAHKDAGLVVLGFPANNFGSQEPGTNLEIAQFCSSKYNVTFPMFEKVSVKGSDMHPLYELLTSQPTSIGGEPKWNFTKFVIDRDGKVVARFDADKQYVRSKQIEPDLIAKVKELLAAKPASAPTKAEPAPASSAPDKPKAK